MSVTDLHIWVQIDATSTEQIISSDITALQTSIDISQIFHYTTTMSHPNCVRCLDFSSPIKCLKIKNSVSVLTSDSNAWLNSHTATSSIPRPTVRLTGTSLARRLSFRDRTSHIFSHDSPMLRNWRFNARLRLVCTGASPGYVASTSLWTQNINHAIQSTQTPPAYILGSCQSQSNQKR